MAEDKSRLIQKKVALLQAGTDMTREDIDALQYPFGTRLLRFLHSEAREVLDEILDPRVRIKTESNDFWDDEFWKGHYKDKTLKNDAFQNVLDKLKRKLPSEEGTTSMYLMGTKYGISGDAKKQWFNGTAEPNRLQAIRIAFILGFDLQCANCYLRKVALTTPLNLNLIDEFVFSYGLQHVTNNKRDRDFFKCIEILTNVEAKAHLGVVVDAETHVMHRHFDDICSKDQASLEDWLVENYRLFKGYSKKLYDTYIAVLDEISESAGDSIMGDFRRYYLEWLYEDFVITQENKQGGTNTPGGDLKFAGNLPDDMNFSYRTMLNSLHTNIEARKRLSFLRRLKKKLSTNSRGDCLLQDAVDKELVRSQEYQHQKNLITIKPTITIEHKTHGHAKMIVTATIPTVTTEATALTQLSVHIEAPAGASIIASNLEQDIKVALIGVKNNEMGEEIQRDAYQWFGINFHNNSCMSIDMNAHGAEEINNWGREICGRNYKLAIRIECEITGINDGDETNPLARLFWERKNSSFYDNRTNEFSAFKDYTTFLYKLKNNEGEPKKQFQMIAAYIEKHYEKNGSFVGHIRRNDLLIAVFILIVNTAKVGENVKERFEKRARMTLLNADCEPLTHRSRLDQLLLSCFQDDGEIMPFSDICWLFAEE